ncbi:MAG: tetratricopeptide repeat protein [Oligoflexia bacterium]|nr:tetratricopeptide repeat protein [Oligoflexia bacterium]
MRDEDNIQTESLTSNEEDRFSHKKEWIVKANSKILGPFTFEEVVENIKQQRFVPHDEIIAPKGRWKLIRQEQVFTEAVNESRNKRGSQVGTESITMTESATVPIDLVEDSFRNVNKLMKGVDDQVAKQSYDSVDTRDVSKIYSYQNDSNVKSKFTQIERVKIFIALGVFIIAGIFTYIKGFKSTDKSRPQDSFQEAMLNAEKTEKAGDFSKALSFYQEARNIKPNDYFVLSKIAPLALVNERQVLQASRIFKQILENDANVERKKLAKLGLGLVALEAHELDEATLNFNEILKQDPENFAASFNMGIVHYFRDRFDEAEESMAKSLAKGGNDGAIVLALADLAVVMQGRLEKAASMLKAYLGVSLDYRPQVLIQLARVLTLQNRNNEATKTIQSILELDPEYVESFVRDWQVYRGSGSWERALENLNKAWGGIDVTPKAQAVKGLVMYWGRDKLEGAQAIEKALSQAPKDDQIMAIAGWVQFKLGHLETASALIKEAALISDKNVLAKVLNARLCLENKDYDCATSSFESALNLDQKSLSSYLGLTEVAIAKNDFDGALKWLRQGQAMSTKFIPFLALNAQIQEKAENEAGSN